MAKTCGFLGEVQPHLSLVPLLYVFDAIRELKQLTSLDENALGGTLIFLTTNFENENFPGGMQGARYSASVQTPFYNPLLIRRLLHEVPKCFWLCGMRKVTSPSRTRPIYTRPTTLLGVIDPKSKVSIGRWVYGNRLEMGIQLIFPCSGSVTVPYIVTYFIFRVRSTL